MALTVTDRQPVGRAEEILSPKTLAFLEQLNQRYARSRNELLKACLEARGAKRDGVTPTHRLDFLPERQEIRDGDWKIAKAGAVDGEPAVGALVDFGLQASGLNTGLCLSGDYTDLLATPAYELVG